MDINKMIAVVQLYIGIRKGVDVNINITNQMDVMLLRTAYNTATNWMERNNVTISHVR